MKLLYSSTRGIVKDVTFEKTVFSGYASDGGLFLPNEIPKLDHFEIEALRNLDYVSLAERILGLFVDKEIVCKVALHDILTKAWSKFDIEEIVKFKDCKDFQILELFHGPSLAFKDLAMGVLSGIMQHILDSKSKNVTVLVGTSGDTGSSAIESVKGLKNVNLIVLLPKNRCSRIQALQMTTVDEPNIVVFEVDGTSDDLDEPIKQCLVDDQLSFKYNLSSMNSINWVRIMVQIVHYFYAYFKVTTNSSQSIEIVVPSGALGNITGGLIAYKMGLPIKLVSCTNENDIVARFFKTGKLFTKPVKETVAPSMDIQMAYNLERILRLIMISDRNGSNDGGDNNNENKKNVGDIDTEAGIVRNIMEKFEGNNNIGITINEEIKNKIQAVFLCHTANDEEILQCIKTLYKEQSEYLICPHTATAVSYCLSKRGMDDGQTNKRVVLATASPGKFPDIYEQIGIKYKDEYNLEALSSKKNLSREMKKGENWMQILKETIYEINNK